MVFSLMLSPVSSFNHRCVGFTASAVLGPNPSAGANAFRGDPFGPGAHAHPRGSGGIGGLGRSSSHDAGKALPAFGWPSNGHNKSMSSAGGTGGIVSNGVGSGGVTCGGAGGVSCGIGGIVGAGNGTIGASGSEGSSRSMRGRSSSISVVHHELQAQPDRPMSLFEGLAGAAAYLADMVSEAGLGEHAWFPSLEL